MRNVLSSGISSAPRKSGATSIGLSRLLREQIQALRRSV
jgi:hypothetical protein